MKLEELAAEGRYAWDVMMFYLTDKVLPDPEYRRDRIHTWNKRWFKINQQIRDGKYDK